MKRALLIVALCACGPTVGDPCTTSQDCLGRTCLNGASAPGGYCTTQCVLTDASGCPTGTACVADAIARDLHGCLRLCSTARDCRPSYKCDRVGGSAATVCTGTR